MRRLVLLFLLPQFLFFLTGCDGPDGSSSDTTESEIVDMTEESSYVNWNEERSNCCQAKVVKVGDYIYARIGPFIDVVGDSVTVSNDYVEGREGMIIKFKPSDLNVDLYIVGMVLNIRLRGFYNGPYDEFKLPYFPLYVVEPC